MQLSEVVETPFHTLCCAGKHPNAGDGLWGSGEEVPTFLYAMPLGGNRVFLEETALVAKPALPFAVLKRRLERRLHAMGVKVKKVGVSGGVRTHISICTFSEGFCVRCGMWDVSVGCCMRQTAPSLCHKASCCPQLDER
jgi:hypothetical protein